MDFVSDLFSDLTTLPDDKLVDTLIDLLWQYRWAKDPRVKPKIEKEILMYHNEAIARGKPHLWNKAKSCCMNTSWRETA